MCSEPYADVEEDNAKVGKLTTISPALKKEIREWKAFRSSTLNRLRVGAKVAEVTHEHECQTMLRFFGYLHSVCEMREPTMKKVFCNHGVGVVIEDYAKWLEAKQLKCAFAGWVAPATIALTGPSFVRAGGARLPITSPPSSLPPPLRPWRWRRRRHWISWPTCDAKLRR